MKRSRHRERCPEKSVSVLRYFGYQEYERTLAYLGHFATIYVSMLLQMKGRYVVDIATNMESLKHHFMSCGNCDELEQMSQE
jgi:hypothetical protein